MGEETVQRWSLLDRVAHWLLMVSVVILILTGLPLFHPEWFGFLGRLFTGTGRALLHRVSAVLLAAAATTHLCYRTRNPKTEVVITAKDIKDMVAITLHWFGLRKEYPEIGFHHPGEKFVYWGAAVFGTLASGVSGLLLWFPEILRGSHMWASLIHDIGFGVILILVAGHFMLAINHANWPVLRAMLFTGRVTRTWARHHHPAWVRDLESRRHLHPRGITAAKPLPAEQAAHPRLRE